MQDLNRARHLYNSLSQNSLLNDQVVKLLNDDFQVMQMTTKHVSQPQISGQNKNRLR
jgi:hypothetical protein